MHWHRAHVNPMLALRTAVCNDRWSEQWSHALQEQRLLSPDRKQAPTEHQAPARLVEGAALALDDVAPSTRAAGAPGLPALAVLTVLPPRSLPPAPQPSRSWTPYRVPTSPLGSGERRPDTCLCGTPLVLRRGHRSKRYCSTRCRMRAYRQRSKQAQPSRPRVPLTILAPSCRASPAAGRKGQAKQESRRVSQAGERAGGVRGETCLWCGTWLVQVPEGRLRAYCSNRCRQRAYRERQARFA